MGTPKALLTLDGETFLDRLIRLLSPVCYPLIVAVGRDADPIRAGIRRAGEVIFAVNPDPDRGMPSFSSSLTTPITLRLLPIMPM